MTGLWLLPVALARTPWSDCNPTLTPLTWADLYDTPPPFDSPVFGAAVAPDLDLPTARVAVDADGLPDPAWPVGPALVEVPSDLAAAAILEMYAGMAEAGTEPVLAHVAHRPIEGAVAADHWQTVALDCRPGRKLVRTPCEARSEAWLAVVSDPRCEVDEPLDGPLQLPTTSPPVGLEPFTVDPTSPGVSLRPDTTWRDLLVDPPPWVVQGSDETEPVRRGPTWRHHQDLQVRKRVMPAYPESATVLKLGDQRCTARVTLDETGTPYDIWVYDCPRVYHPNVLQALLQWRWWPVEVDGERSEVTTDIEISFKLR